MDRRNLLRLAAGGSASAMALATSGCGLQMPTSAISPWQGPGAEPDTRRWMLGYAILAPHSHNLQSWLLDLRTPDEIVLHCDLTRLLPETDPFSRQIMMSHGTFLELLDIAARERGLKADIALFPEGPFGPAVIDQRPVARIRLAPDPAAAKDPLFAQILQRRTNRSAYDISRPVTAAGISLQPLQQALQEYPEQAIPYAAIRKLLGAPQPARTVQMCVRAGFAPPVGPAPRRGVDAQIMRA
jgi:hypothetical protein